MKALAAAVALTASCAEAPSLVAGAGAFIPAPRPEPFPGEFIPPVSPGVCREKVEPFRGRRAYLFAMHDAAGAAKNEEYKSQAWNQCAAEYQAQQAAEEEARVKAIEDQNRVAQDALLRRAQEQEAAHQREEADEERRREESARMAIGNAVPVESPPDPAPPSPPKPRRMTAAERQRAEMRRAARDQRERELASQAAEAAGKFCGPAPERSKWDGIYFGLARAYKTIAHDPGSIEFVSCSDATLRPPPVCWAFSCDVRGKNMLGAKVLSEVRFKRTAEGWFTR
jgi:hypothetical protein